MPDPSSSVSQRRRRLLQALGTASGGAALASLGAAQEDQQEQQQVLLVEQADRCIPVTPLSGSQPVEALYDYAYPQDRFDGPPGSDGDTFSSEGTTDLQRDRTSLLFLYEGPNGLSLVVVHGHLDGANDAGGTVTFGFHGLPTGGQWIVRDDHYVDSDTGLPADSNYDRWDVGGDVHTVDWAYKASRTDGGAFRGLGADPHVRIEPAFNDAAGLAGDHDYGPLENWELLSGDRAAPDRHSLLLDRPLVIRRGSCEGTGGEEQTETTETAETKHERKQRKHERKQEKKQQKRERKDEKKQEKHERKQRKHERKEEKERRKHERKQRKHERKQQKHDDEDDEEDEDEDDEEEDDDD